MKFFNRKTPCGSDFLRNLSGPEADCLIACTLILTRNGREYSVTAEEMENPTATAVKVLDQAIIGLLKSAAGGEIAEDCARPAMGVLNAIVRDTERYLRFLGLVVIAGAIAESPEEKE